MCSFERPPLPNGTTAPDALTSNWQCPFHVARRALTVDRHQYVFHQGDAATGAYCLTSGLVALQRVNEKGDMVIFRLLRPGAFFSCCDLFGGFHRNSAQAITPATMCRIDRQELLAHANHNLAGADRLLDVAFRETRDSEDEMFRLHTLDLPERVVFLLTQLADRPMRRDADTVTFSIPVRRKDLAAMAGTSPEVLSRTIRRLENSGVAKFDGQRVTLWRSRLECDTAAQLLSA